MPLEARESIKETDELRFPEGSFLVRAWSVHSVIKYFECHGFSILVKNGYLLF